MANDILYAEVSSICVLILLMLCVKVKKSMFLQEQRRLFLKVAASNALLFALDAIWIFVEDQAIAITFNWLVNILYFILSVIIGYYWFVYSETVQDSKLVREKKYRWITYLPIIFITILAFASIKTGWIFYIDSKNSYHRGPAYGVQLVISYGYVIFTATKSYYYSRHTDDYRKKTELRTLSFFVLPSLVTGILQIFTFGFPVICLGNTLGILYTYLTLQEQLISVDTLTRLNNRNQLFQYLSTKLAHPREKHSLYLLIMDIDYFKLINDQYGHVEGDRALKIVANCLTKACHGRNYFISRYGGDEFIVLCELEDHDTIQRVCDNIHAWLKKSGTSYALTLSIGYAKYEPEVKSQLEFIALADKELYKIKKSRLKSQNKKEN